MRPLRQGDFFVCDIFDAVPKGDMASMEHPIFSLSTAPDRRMRRYEHRGNFIEIRPSADGLATMHDRDVLIYCISQAMAALKNGESVEQVMRFQAYDLLTATNRDTSGQGYRLLKNALERLAGTRITTNIQTGDHEVTRGFGLIESFEIVRESRGGRMQEVEIKLSDWVFNSIRAAQVLTLHRDYFRLRKPLERRLYELARKHCGNQAEFAISLEVLQKKCGSNSRLKEFRRMVRRIITEDENHNHLPDYQIRWCEAREDMVVMRRRRPLPSSGAWQDAVFLAPDAHEAARQIAPGYDVHALEAEWREWMASGLAEPPRKPTEAFLGFVRVVYERRGPLR